MTWEKVLKCKWTWYEKVRNTRREDFWNSNSQGYDKTQTTEKGRKQNGRIFGLNNI